jgi:crotonobetainyl-CoA:carnitine CoA-transferase CaiB-like acyl-CoA transferase
MSVLGQDALRAIWSMAAMPAAALDFARLTGADPVLPSSFAVGLAAQSTIAAAALAACELGHLRGMPRQTVAVDMRHAAFECLSWYWLNGQAIDPWDAFAGLYRTADGWVRLHTNFSHHRDGALSLLGLQPAAAQRTDVERALLGWKAVEFETAAAQRGLVATALRRFDEWDATPQGRALAGQPLLTIERIDDAPPVPLPPLTANQRPLHGLRVLDLTRILAGPVGGRALAAYGADVLLINSPHLPNIDAIADTSRGKRSAHVDLRDAQGRATLKGLVGQAHVFMQGYRPGGLVALGFGPQAVAALRPGVVCVSLTAYGTQGPWAEWRGFDSLVQTAMGFNQAEGQAFGDAQPRPLPMQILDHATGYLMAMGAAAALHRQQREGGSWHVQVSLAQTAQWLRKLPRVANDLEAPKPDESALAPYLETTASGFGQAGGGQLTALRHSAQLARTPAVWPLPSMPPGSHAAIWV